MYIMFSLFIFIFGLIIGSFLNVLIYRIPKYKSILGRSYCPKCKKKIAWYDNIPLISFILLHGKCRNCKKSISLRYPVIELLTGFIFILFWVSFSNCITGGASSLLQYSPICGFFISFKIIGYIYIISLFCLTMVIFIIDAISQIIPDSLSFALLFIAVVFLLVISPTLIWIQIFSGLVSSVFLLVLNMVTKGRGMGLGDVKLALPLGIILGPIYAFIWIVLSFLTGALAGLILILTGKSKLKSKIAFGPFMVISFWITLYYGGVIVAKLFS